MHTRVVLQHAFQSSFSFCHSTRLSAVVAAVDACSRGTTATITGMGRQLASPVRIKHAIKRMDRLVGNPHLHTERRAFYRAMTQQLIGNQQSPPLILVDWSDFSENRQQQWLRASIALGGRALALYDELHPYEKLNNRGVVTQFLDRLARMLPVGCQPIIIADAGFKTPFYRKVEALGWSWVGRLRGRDFIQFDQQDSEWISGKSLYPKATQRAADLGPAHWVRSNSLACRLVLFKSKSAGRHDRNAHGQPRRNARVLSIVKRQREPWLLVSSRDLDGHSAAQICALYRTRMQIEENFRDTKSLRYGLGISRSNRSSIRRAENLLLLSALTLFVLWLIGTLAKQQGWMHWVRPNSSSTRSPYSVIFLARLLLQHCSGRLRKFSFEPASELAASYANSLWKTM